MKQSDFEARYAAQWTAFEATLKHVEARRTLSRDEIGEYGDLESYLDEYAASTEITPTTSAATTTTAIFIDESDFDSYVDNYNETDSEYDYDITNYDYEIIEDKPPVSVTSVTNSTTTTSTVTVCSPGLVTSG